MDTKLFILAVVLGAATTIDAADCTTIKKSTEISVGDQPKSLQFTVNAPFQTTVTFQMHDGANYKINAELSVPSTKTYSLSAADAGTAWEIDLDLAADKDTPSTGTKISPNLVAPLCLASLVATRESFLGYVFCSSLALPLALPACSPSAKITVLVPAHRPSDTWSSRGMVTIENYQDFVQNNTGKWSAVLTVNASSFDEQAVSTFNTQLALTLQLPAAHIETTATAVQGSVSTFQVSTNVTGLFGAQIIQAYRRYRQATDFLNTTAASQALKVQVIDLQDPVDEWPSNEKRAALYWDGKNPIYMPRSLLATGNVAEMVYSFSTQEMDAGGIIVNGTHAIFPLPNAGQRPLIRAGVAQKFNTPGMERTRSGVAVLQALQTPISMFPNTLGGFAEKIAITNHTGDWGAKAAANWEEALTIPPTQMSDLDLDKTFTEQPPGLQWLNRSRTLFGQMSQSRFGASLLESLADPYQLAELKDMQDAKMAPPFVSQSPQELSSEAARWNRGASGVTPEGHMTNCIHFTNAEGVTPLPGAMAFPLDTPIVTYKGHTEHPSHTISMMAGIGAFYYNEENQTLEIRMAFSLEGRVRDPDYTRTQDAMTQAVYTQGPPNGVDFPSVQKESDGSIKDGRDVSKSVPVEAAYQLYKELTTRTPIDFGMMYLNLSHWCTGEKVQATAIADLQQFWLYTRNESTGNIGDHAQTPLGTQVLRQASAFDSLQNSQNFYVQSGVTITFPCGNIFERSPTGPRNFAGLLEITTWSHFMLEQSAVSPEIIYHAASRQGWDDVQ